MAIAEITGTQAVDTTEHSLATDSSYSDADAQADDGVVQAFLDVSDMVAGDQLQVRVYEKVRSGDTQRIVYEAIEWRAGQSDFRHARADADARLGRDV